MPFRHQLTPLCNIASVASVRLSLARSRLLSPFTLDPNRRVLQHPAQPSTTVNLAATWLLCTHALASSLSYPLCLTLDTTYWRMLQSPPSKLSNGYLFFRGLIPQLSAQYPSSTHPRTSQASLHSHLGTSLVCCIFLRRCAFYQTHTLSARRHLHVRQLGYRLCRQVITTEPLVLIASKLPYVLYMAHFPPSSNFSLLYRCHRRFTQYFPAHTLGKSRFSATST